MPEPAPTPDRDTADLGLRAVIFYKLVKGCASLALALVFLAVILTGHAAALQSLAFFLTRHVSRAWASRAAAALMRLATPHRVELATAALFLDGLLTTIEGWALHTRRWWAEWLVVVASGALLPYEIVELVRRPRVGRALVFLANLAIVLYLARRALEHARRSSPPR